MNEITSIIELVQNMGFIGLLIVLAIPKLRKLVFNGNEEIKELKAIKDNHLHHITEKLDSLIEEERRGNEDVRLLLKLIEHERTK